MNAFKSSSLSNIKTNQKLLSLYLNIYTNFLKTPSFNFSNSDLNDKQECKESIQTENKRTIKDKSSEASIDVKESKNEVNVANNKVHGNMTGMDKFEGTGKINKFNGMNTPNKNTNNSQSDKMKDSSNIKSSHEDATFVYRGDLNLDKYPPPEKDVTDKLKKETRNVSDDRKKNLQCKYFKNGFCKFVNKCKFNHLSENNFKENPTKEENNLIQLKNTKECQPDPIERVNLDHQSEADQAKAKGNKYYMDGNYSKAYEMYSLAIIYSTEALATFYSNRSNTCIQMKDYYKALSDAEKCIDLRPEWSRGYYRKAVCLMNLGDKDNSQKYFKKSYESAINDKEKEEIKKFIIETSGNDKKLTENQKQSSNSGKLLNFLSNFSDDNSDSDEKESDSNTVEDQLEFLMSQFIKPHEDDAFRSLAVYHGVESGELDMDSARGWIKFGMTYGAGDSPDLLKALKEYITLTDQIEIDRKLEEIIDLCGFIL